MKRPLQFLAVSTLLAARLATAQESLRNSLAGDAAAAAQSQQQASQNYTYKAGDFRLLVAPSMEVDWNDNVNLLKTNAISSFILQPAVQLTGSYPLTQHNLLSLSVGISYVDYPEYSTLNGLRVSSDSLLSFNTYIKDFVINLHDRFSLTEDSTTEPAVSGTSLYGEFNNTAGLTTTWDLRDIVLTLGCDYQISLSPSSQFSYLNHSSELPLARAGLHLGPDLTAGVEASASSTTYDQAVLNDYETYSAGIYADWKLGSSLHVKPRVGYTIDDFEHTSQSAQIYYFGRPPTAGSIQTADLGTWYADLTMSHQVTKAISYGFSAGHEVRPGLDSDAIEDYYFRPNLNLAIIKDVSLNVSLTYERGNQGAGNVTGNLVENYNYYGGSISVGYQLMKRLQLSLNYRLTIRSSDIPSDEYSQDQVGLRLTYTL